MTLDTSLSNKYEGASNLCTHSMRNVLTEPSELDLSSGANQKPLAVKKAVGSVQKAGTLLTETENMRKTRREEQARLNDRLEKVCMLLGA